ncbi:hypothetical protein [Streptomyces sp. NPDC058657]|uniref:hypothetical protein n=1 Tax=unclassified Streptomyces TaxID=2593676 RepID=UPI00365296C4
MQRRTRRTALAVLLTVTGSVVLPACDAGDGAAPAVTTTVTAPGPTVTVTTTPTVAPAPTPTTAPPAARTTAPQEQNGGRPTVELTGDPAAAVKELARLKKTGWWNPDKIEYSDDPVTTLQQFDRWLSKGYIAPGGGWTPAGVAAVEAANESGEEM